MRPSLDYAREYCLRVTRDHYENFPVASLLVPAKLRQHISNIYAFARGADDFADEPSFEGERMERLDEWEEELKKACQFSSTHPVFVALEETIRNFAIPEGLLLDLIKAFKMDVAKDRYKNFDEVLYYCRHSANPVGRLILILFGFRREDWFLWSDHICTALQLANFWQDVSVDLKKGPRGRIYIPQEEMVQFGVTEYDLERGRPTPNIAALVQYQVERTERFFLEGRPLCMAVRSCRLSFELKLTWLGGTTILKKIRANTFNIFERPVVTKADWVRLALRALLFF